MKGNTSVSLGPHFEGLIADKIASGRYKNASEVIRQALRTLEDEEKREEEERKQKIEALRIEIQKGLNSGAPIEVDFDELLAKFKADRAARLGQHGQI